MKERHGAATRAGHLETSLNTDTGSVHFISEPHVLKKKIRHLSASSRMLLSLSAKKKKEKEKESSSLLRNSDSKKNQEVLMSDVCDTQP